jgi:hypothetical protein
MIACSRNRASNFTIKPSATYAIQHKTKYDEGKKIKKDHPSSSGSTNWREEKR